MVAEGVNARTGSLLPRLPGWKLYALVLAGMALAGGAGWLVFFSSLMDVEQVEVVGAERVPGRQVQRAAALAVGQPTARLDVAAVAAAVGSIPGVLSVNVARQWPDTVRVTVIERDPVAVLNTGAGPTAIDSTGAQFPVSGSERRRLPVIRSGSEPAADALLGAAQVVASLPAPVLRRVEQVHAPTRDSITLALANGDQVVWGSADDAELKGDVLGVLLGQPAQVYDVSVPEQPTTS